ncbi:MAG: peptidylprolyl isomerase [Rhodocyclaceae bacterium]|nr:peptidylprolyl isomerase [Rhodocyclaceae bacterium]MBX3667425.1 peptidylprolyl isomerase [Rhodocyclaceae bacterium]
MTRQVADSSLVTLHFRLSLPGGGELISTFDAAPATLQLGKGELAPGLERCLAGLYEGDRKVFEVAPDEGFGLRQDRLVQRIPRADLPSEIELAPQAVIEFSATDGTKYAGVVVDLDDEDATIDFNHPLAGKTVRFEVLVVGVC